MTRWVARVRVMPRAGLLDPQGTAVAHALSALGFAEVGDVRVGRMLEIRLDGPTESDVRAQVRAMCEKLVANPVTEDFSIDAVEAA